MGRRWLRRAVGSILCAALLCLAARSSAGTTLTVAVEDSDNSPMEFVDAGGRLTGFHIELVRAVCGELGWSAAFDRVPWQRAQALLQSGGADAVTYLVRSPERDAYAVFLADNALSESLIELWIRKGRGDEIRWDPPLQQMMQRWRFGGIQGWFYSDDFRKAVTGGTSVDMTAPTLLVLGRMLVAGRIDIAAAGPGLARQVGMVDPDVAAQLEPLPAPVWRGGPVYIAFTRKADGPTQAKEFAAAYAAWRRSAGYRTLIARFGVADRIAFEPID